MATYSDIVQDSYKRPVPGASVFVFNRDGTEAGISPNPVLTDAFGAFTITAPDAVYDLEYRYGGVTLRQDSVIVGNPDEYRGLPGPAANFRATLAALKSASITDMTSVYDRSLWIWETAAAPYTADDINVVKANSTPLTVGAWLRQLAPGVMAKAVGTGSVLRPIEGKAQDTVSLLDFIPVNLHAAIRARTSTVDVTSFVQAAMDAVRAAGGGKLLAPAGRYRLFSTVIVPAGVSMHGDAFGWTKITGPAFGTVFSVAHTGHAFRHISPINNQTNACVTMRDFFIFCEDANASIGAGYYDQGGSYNQFDRIFIHGFKYGMIFDQTEQTEVAGCVFYEQKHSGIWLVNGPDLNNSALLGYTNRIQVRGCEFNQQVKFGILDDGGLSHDYISNNFNGCVLYAIRIAGYTNAIIEGGESEHHGQGHVLLSRKTFDASRFLDAVQTIRISGLRGTSDGVGAFVKVEDAGVGDGTVVASLSLDANNVSGLGTAAIIGCQYIVELNTRGNLFPSYDMMRDARAFKRTSDTERRVEFSQTYTLPVVNSGGQSDQDFVVPGVVLGDIVLGASFSRGSGGLVWTYPRVEASNSVRISFLNQSGTAAGGGAAGTLRIVVMKL